MIQAHIIAGNPQSLFSQGIAMILGQNEHYRCTAISYADSYSIHSWHDTLPVLIWSAHEVSELLKALRIIRKTQDKVLVIAQNQPTQEELKTIMQTGRAAVVSMNSSMNELNQYVHELVNNGRQWILSPDIISILIEQILVPSPYFTDIQSGFNLNKKERQIINCARKGFDIEETARELHASKNTIAVYRSKILKKAGSRSIAEFLAKYSDDGLPS